MRKRRSPPVTSFSPKKRGPKPRKYSIGFVVTPQGVIINELEEYMEKQSPSIPPLPFPVFVMDEDEMVALMLKTMGNK
jgi:hypothetical protein